jgi:hypothetical protein
MNRHWYGEAYGCPVSDIEYNREFKKGVQNADVDVPGWRERRRLSARIIDDQLVVKIDRSRLFLVHFNENKAKATNLLECGIASHLGAAPWWNQREKLKAEEDKSLHFRCRKCKCELRCVVMDRGHFGEIWGSENLDLAQSGNLRNPPRPEMDSGNSALLRGNLVFRD